MAMVVNDYRVEGFLPAGNHTYGVFGLWRIWLMAHLAKGRIGSVLNWLRAYASMFIWPAVCSGDGKFGVHSWNHPQVPFFDENIDGFQNSILVAVGAGAIE